MTTVIVQHNVSDFDAWKPAFDNHSSARTTHGCTSVDIYRGSDDANAITVLMSYPDLASAKAFVSDPSLKEAMSNAGVTGPPTISFIEPA
jgi:quinol monooxygenase YgiN